MNLLAHQRRGVEIARETNGFLYQWACGTGKTIMALAIAAEPMPEKTLVVCPKSVIGSAWLTDAANHFPALKVQSLRGNNARQKAEAIAADWDVGVCNFDYFRLNVQALLGIGVRRFIIDEASFVRNPKAQITIAAIRFADVVRRAGGSVYLLSANPSPKDGSGYWAMGRLTNPSVFGMSFWGFANRYLAPIMQKVKGRDVIRGWRWNQTNKAEFDAKLKSFCWALTKKECVDLPPQTDQIIEVDLGAIEKRLYRAAAKELRVLGESGKWTQIAQEAALMKMRQCVGGACRAEGVVNRFGDSKLTQLRETVSEIGEPVVIWAEFTHSIDRIVNALLHDGFNVGTIDGRTSHLASETVQRFVSGEINVVVAHPAAAGHGTNGLQRAASTAIFYELSFDADKHDQARDRIHRLGMGDSPATYIYLLCPDTVDYAMYRVLKGRMKESAALAELMKRDWKREEAETAA